MENPTDVNRAKPGWMGLLEVVWGRERPRILRCAKATILSFLLLPFLLTKSHVLIWVECKSQSEGLYSDQRVCRRWGRFGPICNSRFFSRGKGREHWNYLPSLLNISYPNKIGLSKICCWYKTFKFYTWWWGKSGREILEKKSSLVNITIKL